MYDFDLCVPLSFVLFIYLSKLSNFRIRPLYSHVAFLKKKNLWTKGVIDILLRPLNLRVNVSYGSCQPQ